MARFYIGTSGWAYKDWGKKFFPKGLPVSEHLSYLADHFNTVEINASFYRLQPAKNYRRWREATPKDFIFSIKVSRYITHIKRMEAVVQPWKKFFKETLQLKQKQGPFLFQFPAFFTGRPDQVKRIDQFLRRTRKGRKIPMAFEFRHANCFSKEMLKVLEKHKVALVFANSAKYPAAPSVSFTDFVYFRLHGPKRLFGSSYSQKELQTQARIMKKYQRQGKDVYAYFNNDMDANAPANAKLLQKLLRL
jgi:uncharacterized protein YecE (DUF72 family)